MSEFLLGPLNFGLAIYPAEAVRQAAHAITDGIEQRTSLAFRLDDEHIPHITLFQGGFAEDARPQIEAAAQKWASTAGLQPFQLTLEGKLFHHPIGNVFWNTDIPEALRALHLSAIAALRPLTGGRLMQQFITRMTDPNTDLPPAKQEMVRLHGFSEAGDFYQPHITLGRLADKKAAAQLADLHVPETPFTVDTIIGGPLGDVGNIREIWFQIPVGN